MKVAILTQYFPPEPARIPRTLVTYLRETGHETDVVTGFPNYPTGSLYSGFSLAWRRDEIGEYGHVRRTYVYPGHDRSPRTRFLNYVSFALSSTIAARNILRRADLVYVYGSPVTAGLAPLILATLRQVPYVIHVQDLWPESVVNSGFLRESMLSRVIYSCLGGFSRLVYRNAAAVIAIAPTMAETLRSKGVDPGRIHTILNWADESQGVDASRRSQLRADLDLGVDDVVVMYAGNLGPLQGLDVVLDAFALIPDSSRLKFVIAGSGVSAPSVMERCQRPEMRGRVRFLGRLSQDEMSEVNSVADVQLVSLIDRDFFRGTIPGKYPAILANRQPILCTVPGDAGRFIEEADAGWVTSLDVHGLTETLLRIESERYDINRKAENAGALYASLFRQSAGLSKLVDVLHEVSGLKRSKSSRRWPARVENKSSEKRHCADGNC